jgi:hypothetical protein
MRSPSQIEIPSRFRIFKEALEMASLPGENPQNAERESAPLKIQKSPAIRFIADIRNKWRFFICRLSNRRLPLHLFE